MNMFEREDEKENQRDREKERTLGFNTLERRAQREWEENKNHIQYRETLAEKLQVIKHRS